MVSIKWWLVQNNKVSETGKKFCLIYFNWVHLCVSVCLKEENNWLTAFIMLTVLIIDLVQISKLQNDNKNKKGTFKPCTCNEVQVIIILSLSKNNQYLLACVVVLYTFRLAAAWWKLLASYSWKTAMYKITLCKTDSHKDTIIKICDAFEISQS